MAIDVLFRGRKAHINDVEMRKSENSRARTRYWDISFEVEKDILDFFSMENREKVTLIREAKPPINKKITYGQFRKKYRIRRIYTSKGMRRSDNDNQSEEYSNVAGYVLRKMEDLSAKL